MYNKNKYFNLIKFFFNYHSSVALGILLSVVTLLTSIFLLALSGWFIASSALVGTACIYTFNYMLPAASVRFASIIRTAGRWAERVVSHEATLILLQNIRIYTFTRLIKLTPSILTRFHKSEIMNIIVADVDTLNHLYLRVLSPLVSTIIVISVITCVLSIMDLYLSMIICTIMLFLLLLFPPLFYYSSKYIGNKLTILRSNYRLQLTNLLKNNAELTVYGASNSYKRKLSETEQRWQRYQRKNNIFITSIQSLLLLITFFYMIKVLLLLDSRGIDGNGALVALFLFTTLAVFEALGPVANAFNYFGQVIASAISINKLINLLPEVVFPIYGPAVAKRVSIIIEKLQFKYKQLAEPAIINFSINVAPGKHIAIIGHTGCGKSTLLQLLTRALDPTIGVIKFNNLPLSQWSEKSLRAMTAIVPQRIHIFSSTLRDNLCIAGHKVSDKKIFNILEQLELDNLFKYKGLNTYLGEGGRRLSGGEQRRIGIARALLHNAPLLLLDEPTEGLDVNLEKRIIAIILKLSKARTLIMITHHLQGLDIMDRIYIMDRGSIIEQGNHLVLMNHRGRYYKYCKQQLAANK